MSARPFRSAGHWKRATREYLSWNALFARRRHEAISWTDGDGDGVKETRVKHYINSKGDTLYSMATKDILWAWSSQSRGGAEAEKNYVIRDSNCDGVFNERYTLDDEYHVPDCLK